MFLWPVYIRAAKDEMLAGCHRAPFARHRRPSGAPSHAQHAPVSKQARRAAFSASDRSTAVDQAASAPARDDAVAAAGDDGSSPAGCDRACASAPARAAGAPCRAAGDSCPGHGSAGARQGRGAQGRAAETGTRGSFACSGRSSRRRRRQRRREPTQVALGVVSAVPRDRSSARLRVRLACGHPPVRRFCPPWCPTPNARRLTVRRTSVQMDDSAGVHGFDQGRPGTGA